MVVSRTYYVFNIIELTLYSDVNSFHITSFLCTHTYIINHNFLPAMADFSLCAVKCETVSESFEVAMQNRGFLKNYLD